MKIEEWNEFAFKHLAGCTIIGVKWQTPRIARQQYGWERQALELILKRDGKNFVLTAMADDEGNGPGALSLTSFETKIIKGETYYKLDEVFPVQYE